MAANGSAVRYPANLVRSLRLEEARRERRRRTLSLLSLTSFGILALALLFSVFQILIIEDTMRVERAHLQRIKEEFGKYRKSQLTVDKADLETLDQLRRSRILWSDKLAALRRYLPVGASLEKITYAPGAGLKVLGSLPASAESDGVLTAYEYGQSLSRDSVFGAHFAQLRLLRVQDKGDRSEFELTTAPPGHHR